MTDLQDLYDHHEDYEAIRDVDNLRRRHYLQEVDLWKNRYLRSLFPEGWEPRTIVDVGCSTGDLIGRFPVQDDTVSRWGVDVSRKNIEFARRAYPECNFFAGEFSDFVAAKGGVRIDAVILSDVLEHVEDDRELLAEAGSVSEVVLVNIPMEKCWVNARRRYGPNDRSGHLRAYGLDSVHSLIDDAGLTIRSSLVRYFCRERISQVHLKERLLGEGPIASRFTVGLLKYVLMSILAKAPLHRPALSSNFFALLSREEAQGGL